MRDHITEGEWKTTESEYKCDVHFTNWKPGQLNNVGGNEHCAVIVKSNGGLWWDGRCSYAYQFVCQLLE